MLNDVVIPQSCSDLYGSSCLADIVLRYVLLMVFSQVDIKGSGEISLGSGDSSDPLINVVLDLFGEYDLAHGKIYVGSLGETSAHWLVCRE